MKSISLQHSCTKNMPQRTCIACRKVTTKWQLIRLVRTANGSVEVDASNKKSGRGAYLCRSWECWQIGLKGHRLEQALRTTLAEENRQQLINLSRELISGDGRGDNE